MRFFSSEIEVDCVLHIASQQSKIKIMVVGNNEEGCGIALLRNCGTQSFLDDGSPSENICSLAYLFPVHHFQKLIAKCDWISRGLLFYSSLLFKKIHR